ncbi:MAG TPA: redox-sensing transcriptional repressor Rex [Gemmatimonadales bacterium]|jgi:redox-sensing transcriptional repressor|nr:redox-sensing transcriptional repressor Rex [Gemmatimonadales bacterium]
MRKIADSTVRRLSLYLRFLEEFEDQGIATVSSDALALRGGTTSAQVRKDLSFFGSFGKRGLGYAVPELAGRLREILGLGRKYRVILLGAGKIGSALVQYRGFQKRGFEIVEIFDVDPAKIGKRWNGVEVSDVASLEAKLRDQGIDIAVLVTPAEVAQVLADRIVKLGIKAVLNFAPVQLAVPEDVAVKNVNLALELEALSYALTNR